MAITTMDGLIAALAGAQPVQAQKSTFTSIANTWFSMWKVVGTPGGGVAPASGSGAAPTESTAGAMVYSNATGGNTMYLARSLLVNGSGSLNTFVVVDRLVHTGGLSGTSTSAQTVNSTAITRNYTSGTAYANQLWLEWYTATGTTATTATVSYTNQAGTSGQTATATLPANMISGQSIPVTLAAGDYGVQSVQTVTLAASTGTAGNFGVTLAWRLASHPVFANYGAVIDDYSQLAMPTIVSSACLNFYVLTGTTTSGIFSADLTLAQG